MSWSFDLPIRFRPGSELESRALLFAILFLVFTLQGCAVGDFIGAYFNTYYNAQRAFSEAEAEVLSQQDPKLAGKAFLPPFTVPGSAKTKFVSVIEKCSKLLQYHPESNLVDDALMMIGKSYYYQNEHEKAERKFRELIDGYPESNLTLEARQLLVNTLYRMGNKQAARTSASELVELALAADEGEAASKGSMVLGTLEADNGNFAAARDQYARAAEVARSSEDRFAAWMRVADMEVELGNFDQAATAYQQAERYSTTYLTDYQARIGLARVDAKLGHHEESLDRLDDLLANNNNRDFFGEISLAVGDVYKASGNIDAAVAQYRYVDSAYARTEVSAKSYYALGLIYEKDLLEYDSARVAYNKGKSEFAQAAVTPLLVERSEYMNRYFTLKTDYTKYDSLRTAILHPPEPSVEPPDSSALEGSHSIEAQGEDSLNIVDMDSVSLAGDRTTDPDSVSPGEVETVNPDSVSLADVKAFDPDEMKVPKDSVKAAPAPAPTAPQMPIDSVEARLAHAKTELASLFYTALGVHDSASYWFRRLLNDHPGSHYVPRALFTLAQILSQDSAVAKETTDSLYDRIVTEFPESEFANASRRILGMAAVEVKRDAAEGVYAEAEELLLSGKHKPAIRVLTSVVLDHPESPWAQKAQYAIGWVYEQLMTQQDSAIANYERLVTLYPASEYATQVRPKLAAVEEHKRALEHPVLPDSTLQNKGGTDINGNDTEMKSPRPKELPVQSDSSGEQLPIGVPPQRTEESPDKPKP